MIAAMMLIGGICGRQLVRANAKKTDDVQIFAAVSRAAGRIENFMVISGSPVVTILGVILALMSGYPIFGFLQGAAQNWLFVSTSLLVVVFLLMPTVLILRGKMFPW